MAARFELNDADIPKLIPEAAADGMPRSGGQKVVVPIRLDGQRLALKVIRLLGSPPEPKRAEDLATEDATDTPKEEEAFARARREVGILSKADIPQLARMGPVALTEAKVRGYRVAFYTEEWVEGKDLATLLKESGPIPPSALVQLGLDMCHAIDWLWSRSTIHRDIKPGNIMQRPIGSFVLLDMGLALNLEESSLTVPGITVGTLPYLSPEQLETPKKRAMDFRSDLYALGVTMYEAATGTHPYCKPGMSESDTITRIRAERPKDPHLVRTEIPEDLSEVIMRLLAKAPHLRYRSCPRLSEELETVSKTLKGTK